MHEFIRSPVTLSIRERIHIFVAENSAVSSYYCLKISLLHKMYDIQTSELFKLVRKQKWICTEIILFLFLKNQIDS